MNETEAAIEALQALTHISCSRYVACSNATHASVANLPNSQQLGGTPYHNEPVK